MSTTKEGKEKISKKGQQADEKEEKSFEQKKREAYAAMGRLGGKARAKQLAEKGFLLKKEPKNK